MTRTREELVAIARRAIHAEAGETRLGLATTKTPVEEIVVDALIAAGELRTVDAELLARVRAQAVEDYGTCPHVNIDVPFGYALDDLPPVMEKPGAVCGLPPETLEMPMRVDEGQGELIRQSADASRAVYCRCARGHWWTNGVTVSGPPETIVVRRDVAL